MKNILFSDIICEKVPSLKVIQIEAECTNRPTSDSLWERVETECNDFRKNYKIEEVNKRIAIAATRSAYKALGKEPNRYRPSAEALCRRIINGKGIYRLYTLIDLINLVSIATGYSIGGFDYDKIEGDTLTLDAGKHGEEFNAIGRGLLNIEGLPVYRDKTGGIGTPTSDEERTKLTPDTNHLLMLVNMYGVDTDPQTTLTFINDLLTRYAGLTNLHASLHSPSLRQPVKLTP